MKQFFSIKKSELTRKWLLENEFKYALIYQLNDIIFGDIKTIEDFNVEIIKEAFFFNQEKELRFFEDNDFVGVITQKEEKEEDTFEENFYVKERIGYKLVANKYKQIIVRNYLEYEDDGQAYIKTKTLMGVK